MDDSQRTVAFDVKAEIARKAARGDLRIVTTGGRRFSDRQAVWDALGEVLRERGFPSTTVVHGNAPGADALVDEVAELMGCKVEPIAADWKAHGRSAGPIRNQQMLDKGADVLIAFPGGAGTGDCVRRARRAGVTVYEACRSARAT